ncbi:hypothetical protein ACHAQJ_003080 [Trichoderma viride]
MPDSGSPEGPPTDKPQSFQSKPRTKTRTKPRKKPVTELGKSKTESGDEDTTREKGKKKKEAGDKTRNQDSFSKKKEKATESNDRKPSHDKDQKVQKSMTRDLSSSSATPKTSVAKAPRIETRDSSGDELAWDQDKAEEDALSQQMQQLSLRKARDKRSDDPGMVEWKKVRAWCKDDEVVYFWDPETSNKQRTMLTAWTEETKKFGKSKKDCLVFYSRKDKRAFYCESFEDEEPKAGS